MTVRRVRGAGAGKDADEPPRPKPGLAGVVRSVFRQEITVAEYERLERDIYLEDHTRPELARAAINLAQKNASAAHRLYAIAKVEYEIFEAECNRYLDHFRSSATRSLVSEFKTGVRGGMSKQVTDKDVEARMMKMFPDQVLVEKRRREEAAKTVSHLYRLAELWKERAFALSKLV